MSLIGGKPIIIPKDVTVTLDRNTAQVKGPKGTLTQVLPLRHLEVIIAEGLATIKRTSQSLQTKANHGLVRSLLQNMVTGVTAGFTKRLELIGTGYRVQKQGSGLELSLGFSHPIVVVPKPGIVLEVEGNNFIIVSGMDKQAVGQQAAEIRSHRPPEPYKGKGIKYEDEVIRRKAGKTTAV
ncbi:50S ribosomal protein L6 [Microgenomates group bacterium RIFCSPLOWO2_01_FULL_47_10]|nr:ribosomal protein L6 [uncultured bacterium]OGV92386.1 MAG: 50S ribosomal protein L6 [Microgenomates group bacterium RIFCSPLOWO2_01_FULL_47_10]